MSVASAYSSLPIREQRDILNWYLRNRRDLPWRRTRDPYAILVSEIMLQQTQVRTVVPFFHRWLEKFPDAAALARAELDQVLKAWEGLGYYRRARNLHAAAREIVEKWNGRFPNDAEGLLSLPGVGRYTAGAVGSIAFGLRMPVVDGNVVRVLARYFGIEEPSGTPAVRSRLWETMESWVPAEAPGDFNQAVMELGATVCTPRSPDCGACPLQESCWARRHGRQEEIPVTEKMKSVERIETALFDSDEEGVLLAQRVAGEWHAGFWALPSVLQPPPANDWLEQLRSRFGDVSVAGEPKPVGRYQVTCHRISLRIAEGEGQAQKKSPLVSKRGWEELEELPIVTSHRKALIRLAPGRFPSRRSPRSNR